MMVTDRNLQSMEPSSSWSSQRSLLQGRRNPELRYTPPVSNDRQAKSTSSSSRRLQLSEDVVPAASTAPAEGKPKEEQDKPRGRRAGLRRQPSMINLHNQVVTLNEVGCELFDRGNYSNAAYHFGEALDILIGLLQLDGNNAAERRRSNEDDDMEKFQRLEAESSEFYKLWLRNMELNIIKGEVSCFPIDPKFESFMATSSLHNVSLTVMHNLASVHIQSSNLSRAEDILKLAIKEIHNFDDNDDEDSESKPKAPKKLQFVLMVMSIYNSLGQINLRQFKDQNAMVCFLDGINYGQEHIGMDHVLSAHMYTTIGQNLFQNGFCQEAILAFEEASKIFHRVGKVGGFGLERLKEIKEKTRARAA